MTDMKTRRLSVGEVTLEVHEAGRGDPVVLLHGFPECAYSWRHQVAALTAAGFRCIVPEQRGYNRSDKPEGIDHYRVEKLAGDVAGLLDALELPRAHIVGHDWGGVVAWATASLHPERVDRLVTMNGPHPLHARRELLTNPAQLLRSYYIFIFQIPGVAERYIMKPDFLARAFRGAAAHPEVFTDEVLAVFREAMEQPGAARGMLSWYRASMWRALPKLPPVLARSLVIWGDKDPALGPGFTKNLDRYARDVEVRHIPDSGHWVQQEQPAEVNRLLLEFFGR
jgi:pimeloyl-ACP methyl ester carboxylesterase